jgi:hypothetical protein
MLTMLPRKIWRIRCSSRRAGNATTVKIMFLCASMSRPGSMRVPQTVAKIRHNTRNKKRLDSEPGTDYYLNKQYHQTKRLFPHNWEADSTIRFPVSMQTDAKVCSEQHEAHQ